MKRVRKDVKMERGRWEDGKKKRRRHEWCHWEDDPLPEEVLWCHWEDDLLLERASVVPLGG